MPRRTKSAPTKNVKTKNTKKRTKSAPTKLSKNNKSRTSSAKSRTGSGKSRTSSAKSRTSSAKSRTGSAKSRSSNSGTPENISLSPNNNFEFGNSGNNNVFNNKFKVEVPFMPERNLVKQQEPKPKSGRVVKSEKIYQIEGEFLDAGEVLNIENIEDRITFVRSNFTKKTTHVWLVQIDGKNTTGFPHISCHNDEGYDSAVIHMRFGDAETEKEVWKKLPHTGDWGRNLQVREFITRDGNITGKEPELSLARLIKDKWNQMIAPQYLTNKKLKKLFYREGTATIQPEDMYLKG